MKQEPTDEERQLKRLLQQSTPDFESPPTLEKAIHIAGKQTATRDVIVMFTAWVWVLFAGIGASVYYASQQKMIQKSGRPNKSEPSNKSEATQARQEHHSGEYNA